MMLSTVCRNLAGWAVSRNTPRTHRSFEAIRVGDMIRIGDYHTVVVLEKKENSVMVTEGNYNSSIHWGREITRSSLEREGFSVRTRYPA